MLRPLRRTARAVGVIAAAALLVLGVCWIANPGGWRARIVARLLRVDNDPVIVALPRGFSPAVPAGFQVSVFAEGLRNPRWLAVAPDGDVFVAESGAGRVTVLRRTQSGTESRQIFAEGLTLPFGIAFHDDYVYIAATDGVARFRYDPSTSVRLGGFEHVLALPGGGYNQHWTRSLAFGADGRLFVSIGSKQNVGIESDARRAAILVSSPDGTNARIFASGLRNAVGIAFNPADGRLWATVNERDDVGDDEPADYFTHVIDGGFYGWPYAYGGAHVDNRVASRPDMVARTISPDVLLGAHVAPLQFAFYEATQFPSRYRHGAFIAEHGSWNRKSRSGYDVVFVPFADGRPSGAPEVFLSGLVPDPLGKAVYGRPVGVAVAPDGSLLVSDDGANLIWRIAFRAQ